jgi:hypothetical protein
LSKRKQQQEDAGTWEKLRQAEIANGKNFLSGVGGESPEFPRVLFVVEDAPEAGLTKFLDGLMPEGRRVRVSCHRDDSRDPMFEALVGALWHLVAAGGAEARFCDALYTFTDVQERPTPDDVRRLAGTATRNDAPRRFRTLLPESFEQLWDVLTYVDGTDEPWRLVVEDASVAREHRTLAGAMDLKREVNLEIAIGLVWTREAMDLLEQWSSRPRRGEIRIVKLGRPPRHGLARKPPRKPSFLFTGTGVRKGGTPQEEWNIRALDLVVKTIAALDGVSPGDVRRLGALFHAHDEALRKLVSDYEVLKNEAGEYRVPAAWQEGASAEDLVRFVEEVLASGTENPTADWLLQIAAQDASRSHEDRLASARALLLANAAQYVLAHQVHDQAKAATSAKMLAVFLKENASEASDRHFTILADLYQDSDHLSIIDRGLSLIDQRTVEPSFEEMRFFRIACAAARRYSDRHVSIEAAKCAAGERLRDWVVPYELALLTRALDAVWPAAALEEWLAPFADRLKEFGVTPAITRLRVQEVSLGSRRLRGAWAYPERKLRQEAMMLRLASRAGRQRP